MSEEPARQPTHIEATALGRNEFEVWVSQETVPPSVLIVMVVGGRKPFKIINPSAENETVFAAYHYLDIAAYLREEEYLPVKGRMKLIAEEDDE